MLRAWTVTVRLQPQPGYQATIQRMQRHEPCCPWTSTNCITLAARVERWRIQQAQAFREQVEQFSDAERVILVDADQALLRDEPCPSPPPHW